MTRVLVQVGIYDDGDVAPTYVLAEYDPEIFLGCTPLDQVSSLASLRQHAEREYGRSAPDHAVFWSAYLNPEEQ